MTILQRLQDAGLPVISAEENGQIVMGHMTEDQNGLYTDILTEYFQPAEWQKIEERRLSAREIKTEYTNAIQSLTQIVDASSLTNAQVVQAVKLIARLLRATIKVIYRTL